MKNFRTLTAILLIATLLISGAYATGSSSTSELESLEQEIKALEASLDAKYESYLDLLGDDADSYFDGEFEACDFGEDDFTFEGEVDFLKELGVDEAQLSTFEKAFNEAIAAEESGDFDLADEKWMAYDALFNAYDTDEDHENDYSFEDELEFLQELDLDDQTLTELEVLFNKALNSENVDEANTLWDSYYDQLDEHFDFEEAFDLEEDLDFLKDLGLDELTLSHLTTLFEEALAAEENDDFDLADEKWNAFDTLLEENYDFEDDDYNDDFEEYTFETMLEEITDEGLELSKEDQDALKVLFDQAMESDEWDAFDEKLYELTGWEDEAPITLSAVYNVKDGKLVLSVDPDDYPEGESPKELTQALRTLHQKIWVRANALIPKDYLKFFNKLEVGTDGKEGIMASVVELDDLSKWSMFLDTKDSISEDDFTKDFDFTVIHEFGHVLTLNNTQLSREKQENTYSTIEGHSYEKSYINAFYQKFWKGQDVSEALAENRYESNPNHFVSDYAATNVEEDMAESFATFMTEDKRSGTTRADQKVNFFYDYKELIKMKEDIKAVLSK